MKKADIIRGLKADLKTLEEAKSVSNIEYHRGRMDQLRDLINSLNHPQGVQRYQGLLRILPSRELKIAR